MSFVSALVAGLLFGAGLLISGMADPANVLAFNLLFPDQYSTPRKAEVIETLLGRFRTNPGVQAAGFARHGMLIGEELYIGTFVPPGKTLEEMKQAGTRTRSVSCSPSPMRACPGRQCSRPRAPSRA